MSTTLLLAGCLLIASPAPAQSPASLVRLAELEINPAQLEPYLAALKLEIEASIRTEPGVLTLYAVALKDQPNHIRLFEQYRDQAAYEDHLQSPHFLQYKRETAGMVVHLKLLEATPILLDAKPR